MILLNSYYITILLMKSRQNINPMSKENTETSVYIAKPVTQLNPLMAKYSDGLYSGVEQPFYWINHTIYTLETIHEIVPYGVRNP